MAEVKVVHNNNNNIDDEEFEIVNTTTTSSSSDDNGCQNVVATEKIMYQDEMDTNPVFVHSLSTIELIRQEQKALKDELLETQKLLEDHRKVLGTQKMLGEKKINELNERVKILMNEITEKDAQISNLEKQMQNYKEASEKADELCAKMCASEDKVKYYEEVIHKLNYGTTTTCSSAGGQSSSSSRNQGNNSISLEQQNAQDGTLAREIKDKDECIHTLQKDLVDKEAANLAFNEENLRLKCENRNLTNFVAALQAQIDADQAYIEELKNSHESRVKALTADLDMFLRKQDQMSSNDSSEQPCSTIKEGVKILSFGETHDSRRRIFECERCKLRLPTSELYDKHVSRCPLIVDNVF